MPDSGFNLTGSKCKGKGIVFNVGGRTGKDCVLTDGPAVESRRSSGSNPQPFAPSLGLHFNCLQCSNLQRHTENLVDNISNKLLFSSFSYQGLLSTCCKNGSQYVWVFPGWFEPGWWRKPFSFANRQANEQCSVQDMMSAVTATYYIAPRFYDKNDVTVPLGDEASITVGNWRSLYNHIIKSVSEDNCG